MEFKDHADPSRKAIVNNRGYKFVYAPEHPKASITGYIYEHVYLYELSIGNYISDNLDIHHVDCNKSNNNLSNLIALSRGDHIKLHAWMHSLDPEKYPAVLYRHKTNITECRHCKITITNNNSGFCSLLCRKTYNSENSVSLELILEQVKELGFEATGRLHNVTGNAIKKRLKSGGYDVKQIAKDRKPSKTT